MKLKAVAFTAALLLLCLIPSAGMLVLCPSGARANELAPEPPELLDASGAPNAQLLSDTAEYLNESFAFRQELITLWARVEALFGQSAEDGVILGSDGWLYYAEELSDYSGLGLMTEREIFAAARNLALMAEYVEGLGADFLFTVAPNKSTLYPEHMPHYIRSGAASNAGRLKAALESAGVAYADLFEAFGAREETLYFEHDSHWTSAGAALAADAINAALGVESAYFEGGARETVRHEGDLYEMLYPSAADPETDEAPSGLEFSQGDGVRPDSITIDTRGGGEGALLMFRDSFGELLYPYMADSWAEARFSRQAAYDLSAAAELGSSAVVIELVERNIPWLLEQPAGFPAPERDRELSGAQPGEAGLTLRQDGEQHRVSGAISGRIDFDSPVYISYNHHCYEASLTGDGFSALLPGEGGGEYGIYWYSDGALKCALADK